LRAIGGFDNRRPIGGEEGGVVDGRKVPLPRVEPESEVVRFETLDQRMAGVAAGGVAGAVVGGHDADFFAVNPVQPLRELVN
jgi:hypothetical protein